MPSSRKAAPPSAPTGPADLAAGPDALAQSLERWYGRVARDLPWRRDALDPDLGPYRVWVSEIMLQQTQVATVVPYYRRWMAAFPDVARLAEAPLEAVLGLWAGLGYYARARNLHRAAQAVVARHGGRVPRDPEALRALPGVGPYTVGAVRSIAFGEKVPLVDGNVARVLARLDRIEGEPAEPAVRDRLWARAEALVSACEDPSAFNQGLMELGATVCTPGAPACPLCPWADACEARKAGVQDTVPPPRRRPRRRQAHGWCVVGRRGAQVWLGRRRPEGLLGGLWEPPQVEGPPEGARAAGTVRHVFTHLELTLHVLHLSEGGGEPTPLPETYVETAWVPLHRVDGLGLSALARKALALALAEAETADAPGADAPDADAPDADAPGADAPAPE